jgi:hypothetical protein
MQYIIEFLAETVFGNGKHTVSTPVLLNTKLRITTRVRLQLRVHVRTWVYTHSPFSKRSQCQLNALRIWSSPL